MPFLDPSNLGKIFGSRPKPAKASPPPAPKGPYEKRGGIPRKDFPFLFEKGPFSMPWSRNRGKEQLKKMGKDVLNSKFPSYYGSDISGKEIQMEIDKLRRSAPKTKAEADARQETITRLEDARKRAGL